MAEKPNSPALICELCGGPGLYRCAWIVKKPVPTPASEMEVGDTTWLTLRGELERRPFKVSVIARSKDSSVIYFRVRTIDRELHCFTTAKLMLVRPGPCGVLCCENCCAERDINRHHCRDHWQSWSEVG